MTLGTQLAARFGEPVVAEIDRLVAAGRFPSRAEAVRAAVHAYLEADRRRRVGVMIGEGYERMPETEDELATAEGNLRRLIAEEPW
jgi:Arc/MetJ-type ribon-helix-helix transcriptional regulator